MNPQVLTILMLIVYAAAMIGIGIYASRKTKSVTDFVLGGQKVGPWLTAFAYGTSYFSAVVFIGYAGQFGWSYGISATWVGVGNAVLGSALAWILLGKRTRLMTKHLGSKTMPEFFEGRFGSGSLKTASAMIIFLFLIPYTASVYNGLSRLFNMAFQFQSEHAYQYIIVAMAVLSALYVILGGYAATSLNDFVQGMIMLVGISAVVLCALNYQGGLTEAVSNLSAIQDGSIQNGELGSLFGPDPINLFGVVILTSLGTWGLPQMVHKFYAIKDDAAIKKGTIISTLFALIVAGGCYFLGGFVRLFCQTEDASAPGFIQTLSNGKLEFDAMIPQLLQTALPDILIGLVVVLVLSASLSTLSSLVLTSSTTVTMDLIKPRMKNSSEKQEMLIMRVLIAVFLIISVFVAFNKNASIATLMSYSWGALAGSFLGPFLWGLFSKRTTKAAVWTSFVLGVGLTIGHMLIFSFFPQSFPELISAAKSLPLNLASPINAGALLMLLSIVIVPIVSRFTKPCDSKTVDHAFAAYQNK